MTSQTGHTRASPRAFSVAGVLAASGWAVGMMLGLVWGQLFNWPDYVHVNYGAPLTFATHTTSTFIGAVDLWSLDIGALAIDILFWAVGMVAIFAGFLYLVRRRAEARPSAAN